jgi:acid phosphatase family membrane protein YuiD
VTFEEAFREINGRAPTTEEVKRVLAIRRVVKEADLDPVELFFLADATAAAERARIPAAIVAGVDQSVAKLQQAIPDAGELAKRIALVGALQKTLAALVGYATPIAAVAVIAALVIAVGAWRWGYTNGWTAADNRRLIGYDAYACRVLANVRHTAAAQRHANAVTFVAQEMTARGCR